MAAHSRVGPSSIERVILCPGSVGMCESGPDVRDASKFSAEGSAAHEVRDMCSTFGMDPSDFIGQTITADGFPIQITEEMADFLRPGLEWIEDQPGRVVNEFRVTFDRWMPEQFGTLDVGIISHKLIVINDLKYGVGVPVSAVENKQLMMYALGFWENVARHETEATDFLLVIDQPRARGDAGYARREDEDFDDDPEEDEDDDEDAVAAAEAQHWGGEWRVTLAELQAFGETVKTAFDLASSPQAWLRAGVKQCQFCSAKGRCPEYARWSLALLDLEFADLDPAVITLKDKDLLTPQMRTNVALNMNRVTAWLKATYGSVLQDAKAGLDTPGAKVVTGKQGPRQWRDEDQAAEFVRYNLTKSDAYTEPKLISPAQFEKLKKKVSPEEIARVNDFTTRSAGKPALVGLHDPRTGYDMADDFDDD